jgi:hypothetical protein
MHIKIGSFQLAYVVDLYRITHSNRVENCNEKGLNVWHVVISSRPLTYIL